MNSISPEMYLLMAVRMEAEGDPDSAVQFYRKAYKLKPELEYASHSRISVDGKIYDENGLLIEDNFNEETGLYRDDDPPIPFHPQKFSPGDPGALQHLDEYGFVVFSNAASSEDLKSGIDLFWKHIEPLGMKRNDTSTWGDEGFIGDPGNGIVADHGIGQSEFLWFSRSLPGVIEAFSNIWADDDLLVSFDGCGIFRPLEANKDWRTRSSWFHIDQNLFRKKGRHAVQGLLNYFPAGEHDGGLVVVPRSHTMMESTYANKISDYEFSGDYHLVDKLSPHWKEHKAKAAPESHDYKPVKLCLAPGDFAMWDSRTIHCNHPQSKVSSDPEAAKVLKRLVAYICMTPAKMAKDLPALAKRRINAFKDGTTTTHWPHEYYAMSSCEGATEDLGPKLTQRQKELIASKAFSAFNIE